MARRRRSVVATVAVWTFLVGGGVYAGLEFTNHDVWQQFTAADAATEATQAPETTAAPQQTPSAPAAEPTSPASAAPKPATAATTAEKPNAAESHRSAEPVVHRRPKPPVKPQPPTKAAPVVTAALLMSGDEGSKVRELQARLRQIWWYDGKITGTYGDRTRDAVAGFQAKRGFAETGKVDQQTWDRLVEMTRTPTQDEMHNRLEPGPTLLGPGDDGKQVRELQARLKQIGWFTGTVTGTYGDDTEDSVAGFQTKRGFPSTGEVDQRTRDRLDDMTHAPSQAEMFPEREQDSDDSDEADDPDSDSGQAAGIDPRCQTGRALCIDKTTSQMRWMVDGTIRSTVDVRFGAWYSPTREGLFHVYWKDIDHVSSLYGSAMPYSLFFSGGQAVHYSSDFAARGYAGASHGCVNVRDYDALKQIFSEVNVGDKVVVYRS